MKKQILHIAQQIPLFGSVFAFRFIVLKKALSQLIVVWTLSSLPIIFTIVESVFFEEKSFNIALLNTLNVTVLFIYTAAFLAPVIWLCIDRVVYPKTQKAFPGIIWIFLTAFIFLLFSAWGFDNSKFRLNEIWQEVTLTIYFLSLYFWFLTIADSCNADFDFVSNAREQEIDFVKKVTNG
ncbi:hypothetical protein [Nitrosomonas sp. Nm34]|uniref:hypothetical protein n=1 Tax=Nitrosomonas sp. Nm34 TaxID=1881055 RepID=UPI0008E67AC5|nr:hypothetical protein [Nitrosomonas sp. Nm34]SFI25269.1 hypothetical protein SAMN05428978_100372 [Nitrosomonas sp. Nm34]